MASKAAFTDVKTLRSDARQHTEQGAVTTGYAANRPRVLKLLNDALATEIICVLRYRCHHFLARGFQGKVVASDFLKHSNEEQAHADLLAERIVQLGGEPDLAPDSLSSRSHAEFVVGHTLLEMIREDLVAERVAIESYREMIVYLAELDPTTSQMLKGILALEEQHAEELADLLDDLHS